MAAMHHSRISINPPLLPGYGVRGGLASLVAKVTNATGTTRHTDLMKASTVAAPECQSTSPASPGTKFSSNPALLTDAHAANPNERKSRW